MAEASRQETENVLPLDDTLGALPSHAVHGDGNEREVCVVVAPGDEATASTGPLVAEFDTDNDTMPLLDMET